MLGSRHWYKGWRVLDACKLKGCRTAQVHILERILSILANARYVRHFPAIARLVLDFVQDILRQLERIGTRGDSVLDFIRRPDSAHVERMKRAFIGFVDFGNLAFEAPAVGVQAEVLQKISIVA